MYQDNLKLTKIGWLPKEWDVSYLRDVSKIQGGFAFDSKYFLEQGEFQVLKMSNLYSGVLDLDRSKSFLNKIDKNQKEFIVNKNDILLTLTGTVGKRDYGHTVFIKDDSKWLLNQRIGRIITNLNKSIPSFLYYVTKTERFCDQFFFTARGGTGNQANVGTKDVEEILIPLPPLAEQQKIASILRGCDAVIDKTHALINALQKRHKALMQQLLTGKKRVLGFEKGMWKKSKIKDIATEINIKNQENEDITVLSCTKHYGLVPSLEYFGRQVFSSDISTYKVVPQNVFAYATNHIEEGSIGYQADFKKGLVSPMYTVFKTDQVQIDNFFLFRLLKSNNYIQEYQKRMEGSIDRRGGLRWDAFSDIKINLPSLAEQQKIAEILRGSEKEIQLYEKQLAALKQQKRGLMQVLLTGRVRVKN